MNISPDQLYHFKVEIVEGQTRCGFVPFEYSKCLTEPALLKDQNRLSQLEKRISKLEKHGAKLKKRLAKLENDG